MRPSLVYLVYKTNPRKYFAKYYLNLKNLCKYLLMSYYKIDNIVTWFPY